MNVDICIDNLKSTFNIIGIINCDNYLPSSIDLYSHIKNFYKKEYQSNDRIVFLLNKDYYKNNSSSGTMLQSIQAIVDDIDISNYFVCIVTTNPEIHNEYSWVLDNISTDTVPVHVYPCQGNFETINDNISGFIKYHKVENTELVNELSTVHKKLLFENNSFCMAPWTSIMIEPNSNIKPCCLSTEVIGDCSISSLEQIWNSDKLKQIRKDMLSGKKIKSCSKCHTIENVGGETLRKSLNRRFMNYVDKIDTTEPDGHLPKFELNYIDARFNNLCNLACRSCGPMYSSSWHAPAVKIGLLDKTVAPLMIAGKTEHNIFDQLIQKIDTIDRIYFAGGEPMMIEQFHQLVEELDQRGYHHVELIYNTNMTKSVLKGKSIFEVWKNFKKISIGASLDGENQKGEYLRAGSKWEDVLDFRKQMLHLRPDIKFYVSATTSIINVLHIPDFHRSWVEQGLIDPADFNIQLLLNPDYLRVDTAPDYLKKLIKEKYTQHLEWLYPQDKTGRAIHGFQSILEFIKNDNLFQVDKFWKNINQLDEFHGQYLLDIFPELTDLPKQ
jgi:radical SAM protein with 4Fe4S-binding SPASM domain